MNVKLVMQVNGRPPREIALKPHETVIGRQKGCAIRIASHEISRLHCCLRLQNDKVTVRDLGSANGTFVNGQQIKGEHLLKHGDQLQLGDLTFRVQYEKGQELVTGLPVDSYEYVGEIVQDVVVLDEPKPRSSRATQPATQKLPSAAAKPPRRPAPPVQEEDILDALPAAEVEESLFKPAGASSALPVAEVEQSGMPSAPPQSPAAPAPPAEEEEVPFAALEEVETDDQHPPWLPPPEQKS